MDMKDKLEALRILTCALNAMYYKDTSRASELVGQVIVLLQK